MTAPAPVPPLGRELKPRPKGEKEAIDRIVDLVRATLHGRYAAIRPVPRAQHAKTHGCVKAAFSVADDVPRDLRLGLFSRPRTFDAWIRFSSSAVPPKSDSERDAHGMCIKVMGVDGRKLLKGERDAATQDFTLVNHEVFFCRDAAHYVDFALLVSTPRTLAGRTLPGGLSTWAFFFPPSPANWQPREFAALTRVVSKNVTNPLEIRYWSQTPFALGEHAVKYSAVPRLDDGCGLPRPRGDDGLREAMVRSLRSGTVRFDFMVQRQVDARTMPVEDPTVAWNSLSSPFVKVATIRIPAQEFNRPALVNFTEGLSFTPWHSLPEHRPLGGINRVRKAVYQEGSKLRHELNGVPRREPR